MITQDGLIDKLNRVDEFTRSRVPSNAIAMGNSEDDLSPQKLIDRRLFGTKLNALVRLEEHLQEVRAIKRVCLFDHWTSWTIKIVS